MKLFFKTTVRDSLGEIPTKMALVIQFYNTDTKAWETIATENTGYIEGTYSFEYYIPSRIYGDELTLRKIREVLQTGGMPMFRLIDANAKEQIHILAEQGTYTMSQENDDIGYDFGTLYLLERDKIDGLDNPKFPSVRVATDTAPQDINPEIEELKKEIETLRQQAENSNEAQDTSGDQAAEIESLNARVNSLENDIENLNNEIQTLEEQVETNISEKTILETTIAQQAQTINNQISEINNYQNTESQQQNSIETLESEKQALQNLIDQLSQEASEDVYVPKSVSANKLYTDIIDEIQIAKENTASSGFKLSNISLNLKTVAEKDAQGLRFQVIDINNASTINGAAISDIKIDITENETAKVSELIVPKLIGLTETAARTYLEKFNLRLDPVYQLMNTTNSPIIEGQAFKQLPEPGTVTTPDTTITVIFAKNNQYLN
ncbi:PASTA domain-containing protein [uncultured Dokdonia sp.]|uniref:PASTA domain-containing protein n=1 Tax=uncultured Dokdonia sp. TaxID=575653 RepID=UPI002607276B|nr:PASTA domain-containing protein [uncultured Dokdonia sp.]